MIYGKNNRELVARLKTHPDFRDFVVPIGDLGEIRDATFFLRDDGLFAFSEGYWHPEGKLIGNIIYIPDPAGTKNFFGMNFASVIKRKGKEDDEWITFQEQLEIYRRIDSSTQVDKPIFAENKCLFNLDEFIGYVPPLRSLELVRSRIPEIDRTIHNVAELLRIAPDSIGCTGSMAFGNVAEAHDLDLVFYGTLAESRGIISRIYEITKEPRRRVFEMGMHWPIRFYDDGGNMICPFFAYTDLTEIPLPRFDYEVVAKDAEAVATIARDDHTGFMPTFLSLADARVNGNELPGAPALIIYHGGKRGEYLKGDRVKARGYHIRIRTPKKEFEAILVTDMGNTEKI